MIGELVPITDARRNDLLGESKIGSGMQRTNFAYAAEYGRVYKALALDITQSSLDKLQIERRGNGRDYYTVLTSASGAKYSGVNKLWTMQPGQMHVMNDTSSFTIGFERAIDMRMTEAPADLMAKPRDPAELRYAELTQFIRSLERSGGDANVLRVERALKVAIPVTCLVIALFGAPLATSTQRGGTAYGIGVSLATTVTFLMLIQLTKAVGKGGVVAPDIAAWIPNAIFALLGLILLFRVRT